MKNLCKKCPNKPDCKELCEKATNYVSQDDIKKSRYLVYESELYPADLSFLSNICTLSHQEIVNSLSEFGENELAILKKCNLTENQLDCMYFYYWEKKNQRQIAEIFGISQQAVSKYLRYAKYKLLELLK